MTCVSASGHVLPPMMIFPREQTPPANFHEGAVAQTLFANSTNGWINNDLFLQWFEFFLVNIPPTRPVLLIMDGHGSHMSIELMELAQVFIFCVCHPTRHTSSSPWHLQVFLKAIFQRLAVNTLLLTLEE